MRLMWSWIPCQRRISDFRNGTRRFWRSVTRNSGAAKEVPMAIEVGTMQGGLIWSMPMIGYDGIDIMKSVAGRRFSGFFQRARFDAISDPRFCFASDILKWSNKEPRFVAVVAVYIFMAASKDGWSPRSLNSTGVELMCTRFAKICSIVNKIR